MKHILVHRESRLQQFQTSSAGKSAFGLLPLASSQRFRFLWLTCVTIVLLVGNAMAQCPPASPASSLTNVSSCLTNNGAIQFSAPTPLANYQFSIDGGATFGAAGVTSFTGLAAGTYRTMAKSVSLGCVSAVVVKVIAAAAAPVGPTSTVVNPTNCITPNGIINISTPTPVANYQFSIDGGVTFGATGITSFTGLAAGTYKTVAKLVSTGCVSLTTAGATKTLVTTGAPVAPTSTATPTNCTGATGSITFSAPTPLTNYVFSIDGGATFSSGLTPFTGLAADNYQTIAKNVTTGCVSAIATKAVTTVAAPAAPTATVTNVTNCNSPNGSIQFNSPNTTTHLFSIDGGATFGGPGQTAFSPLAPGTYETVAMSRVTGCVSPSVFLTIVPATAVPAPTSSFTNVSSCLPNNGVIRFTAPTPLANYQFSIDGGVTFFSQTTFPNLAAESYTTVAKLVSTGCVSTTTAASVKVLVNTVAVPVPSFVANNGANNCATPGSIFISAPTPLANYQFSINGGATYQSLVSYPNLPAGTYVLRAKLISTGCESVTASNTTVQIACNNVEICGNGIDDDADGFVDQYDSDCPCTLDGFVNVCQPECEYQPPADPFTIKKLLSTSTAQSDLVAVYQTPMVADVDADGVVEIVGIAIRQTTDATARSTKDILIFNGITGALERTISTGNFWINWGGQSQLAIGNTDKSDAQAEIYTITHSNTSLAWNVNNPTAALTCYKADGTLVWRNTTDFVSAGLQAGSVAGAIGLADFNGDGIAEVYVYNKIYNALTGALLLDGGQYGIQAGDGGGPSNISVAGDLTSHPGLELAAGISVYEITIVNLNGKTGNIITEKSLPKAIYGDALTAIADIDLDGQMDVVIRRGTLLTVYNPRTMAVIASRTTVQPAQTGSLGSNTFIGDVDNDGDPDIGLTGVDRIQMYSYNGTTTLALKWNKVTTDGSGATGITMFDFNQDGSQELVYRDETDLRIIDGATGNNIVTFPSMSGTGWEMPVVADVDNDNQANIVVTSGVNGLAGVIDVFSTASFPWAPARRVWNQVGYNITNINDDLTIPTNPQYNPLAHNGKRIFNNFLQQSTTFDPDWNPVFPAVDVKITFVPDAVDPATGYAKASTNYFSGVCVNGLPVSASLTIPLVNNGNIATPANMPVSIYLGDPFNSASAVLVQTITVTNPIAANGGTFTTGTTINTTGFPTPFKLYAIPGDPGATSGFPLNFTNYFQNLGFCASQSNNAVYGEFSCTCPVINNTLTDNINPTTCGGLDGSIKICGLTPNSTGNSLDYDKNNVAQSTQTNLVADASGCLSLTGLSAGTYNNIKVSNVGCTAGSNLIGPITLTDPAPPAPPVPSFTSLTICTGEPVSVTYTTSSANQTVQWTRMPGGLTGVGNFTDFPTATGTTPVSYTYTAKIIGVVGCESATATTVVLVNPKPQITPSVCSQTICSGQTGAITFISNIPGETIHWERTPLTPAPSSGTGNIGQSLINTGPTSLTYTYTIWAEYTGSVSCPTSNTITCIIVVTPGLTLTASANSATVCVGSPLSLSANVTPAGSYTYVWSGPNYAGSGANPTVSATAALTNSGTYTVVVTDAGGCSGTAVVDVVVTDCTICSLTAIAGVPVCDPGNTTYSVSVTATDATSLNVSAGTVSGNAPSFTITGIPAGTNVVITPVGSCTNVSPLTITAPNCCVAPATPTASVTTQPTCLVPTGTITVTSPLSGVTYSFDGGLTYQASNVKSGLTAGTNYQVIVKDNITGCVSNAITLTVNNASNLRATASSNSPVCSGNLLQLYATQTGGTAPITYSWTGPDNFTSSLQNPSIPSPTAAAGGVYTVTVSDPTCTTTASTTVTIASQPNLAISAAPSLTICSGQPTVLNVTGDGGANVTWTNTLGQSGTGTTINFAGINNVGGQPQTIRYYITASAGGCSDSDVVDVTINPAPALQVKPTQAFICAIEQTDITATAFPSTATINWTRTPPTPPVTGMGTGSVTINEVLPAGNYTYSFTATQNGCTSAPVSVPVTVSN